MLEWLMRHGYGDDVMRLARLQAWAVWSGDGTFASRMRKYTDEYRAVLNKAMKEKWYLR